MKRALIFMMAAAMLLLAFAGCSQGAGNAGGDAAEIVIGGLAPLTGGVSQYGIAASNGAKIAVEEINAAGGVLGKPIKFVVEDEKGDPTEAVNAYNKLVQQDNIVALVGDVTTKPSIAVAQLAEQAAMPMITPTGTGAAITEGRTNVFRACFTDPYQGELMAHYAQDQLSATTAAILYDTTDDYSSGIADTFEATAQSLGMTITAKEGYQQGATDFNSQLTKIKQGDPQVIMVPCYYEDAAKIMTQARDMGITAMFLGSDGWDGVLGQLDASKYDVLDNSYYCSQYSRENPGESLQAFMDKYQETYGEQENMFAVLGYEAMHIMAAAIEKAGSTDSAAIVEALSNLEYPGLTGTIAFRGGQDPARNAYIIEFANGAEQVLGTYSF